MKYDILKTQDKLKHKLSSKRYEHTLGVQYTAANLAMIHGQNIYKAQIAGLLHDCAKHYSDEDFILLCNQYNISITQVEERNPFLLHAKLGAYIANTKYGVDDREILDAITYHTTGRPNMTELEKIVCIADYIEPNRKIIPNLDLVRKIAFEDLDKAMIKVFENVISYINSKNRELDNLTLEAYEYYKNERRR